MKDIAMPIIRLLCLAVGFALAAVWPAGAQEANPAQTEAIHNELRGVLARLIDATNKKNLDALIAELSPEVAFTAINNDTILGADKVRPYFERMLTGSSAFMNDFSIKAEVDQLSKLFAGNKMAIATGSAVGNFDLRGGDKMKFTMPMRWTATLDGSSGKWKLAAIHFSADFAHNPYLSAITGFWKWLVAGGIIAGLLFGYFIGKRRGAAQ